MYTCAAEHCVRPHQFYMREIPANACQLYQHCAMPKALREMGETCRRTEMTSLEPHCLAAEPNEARVHEMGAARQGRKLFRAVSRRSSKLDRQGLMSVQPAPQKSAACRGTRCCPNGALTRTKLQPPAEVL